MTIPGVNACYLFTYALLALIVGRLLDMTGNPASSAIFLVIVAGAAYWPCLMYGRRNRHYFNAADKVQVIGAMILSDMIGQIIFGNVLLPGSASTLQVVLSFALLFSLHGALIALVVQLTGRQLRRHGWIDGDSDGLIA